jgi:hypothetical protein
MQKLKQKAAKHAKSGTCRRSSSSRPLRPSVNNRYAAHAVGFTADTGRRRDAYDDFLAARE